MVALDRLPLFDPHGSMRVVVEVPSGSSAKYKYEPELEAFTFQRRLSLGVSYPSDWGFFPSTLADDGDPLDALVWHDLTLPQGVVIVVRPLALARVSQVEGDHGPRVRNDRVVAVPAASEDVHRLSDSAREQLAQFFVNAARGSGHEATFEGWDDASAARQAIREAAQQFEESRQRSRSTQVQP